jgi:hypothetical protein
MRDTQFSAILYVVGKREELNNVFVFFLVQGGCAVGLLPDLPPFIPVDYPSIFD